MKYIFNIKENAFTNNFYNTIGVDFVLFKAYLLKRKLNHWKSRKKISNYKLYILNNFKNFSGIQLDRIDLER
jgi:hypothetical protein